VTVPERAAPSGRLAVASVPAASFSFALSPSSETISAYRKFVSPMKSATKRSAGRS
jgi:hypothetical protein